MTTLDAPATQLLRASRTLVVEARSADLCLPKYDDLPEVPLGLAELRWLIALASPRSRAELEGADSVLQALEQRDLLVDATDAGAALEALQLDEALAEAAGGPRTDSPAFDDALPLVMPTPVLFACRRDGLVTLDHDGRLQAQLAAEELVAIGVFRSPTTVEAGRQAQAELLGDDALDDADFDDLVRRMLGTGLIVPFDPTHPEHVSRTRREQRMRDAFRRQWAVLQEFDRLEAEHDTRPRPADSVPVLGYHTNWAGLPTSLGMIIAAAKAHDGGRLQQAYDFRPRLLWDRPRLEQVAAGRPGIFLFSNYIWSTADNLTASERVKEISPHHVTIHGGPNTPKYTGDVERFFAENPHVDVAVHGEGEMTFVELLEALRGRVGDGPPDLSPLTEVPGLSVRTPDGVVQTGPRDRIEDLNTLPSPALTGLFDGFIPAGGGDSGLIIETNRGCPYGCTFCDWGSATLSRIRKFDLDRVLAEIEWCAENKLGIGIADANFGIFERDVTIAQHIAELKNRYGWPRAVGNNYAKNTVKHLSKIIEIFTEAGIVAEGKMSMQTFDTDTLLTIRRKNIKVEKYYDLAAEFRRHDLPLVVELMMGLPGSNVATLRADLQKAVDRDVRAQIFETFLLPNSPMNEPTYRKENGIVARPGEIVRSTATYDEADFTRMRKLRRTFYVLENFNVLRQVATYVRAETGTSEIDFYETFADTVVADPERWPHAALVVRVLPGLMVPPVSWRLFDDEVRRYVVEVVGVADDSALETVFRVQHALQPARGRSFPVKLDLPHDYVAWREAIVAERDAGNHADWPSRVRPLRELGPGVLSIDDPLDSCGRSLGFPCDSLFYYDSAWDLDAPVCRPRQALPEDAL